VKDKELESRLNNLWRMLEYDSYYANANTVTLAVDYIEFLEKALELYERERDRFKHAKPEMTGEFFLSGGHGDKDENQLPEFVRICPAYGCAWEQVYQKTDKTITYEGS
jgi:hypothetical protein